MMKDCFQLIAITGTESRKEEAKEIMYLLDNGFSRVHIRKPDWTGKETMALLSKIDRSYWSMLSLHQTPELFKSELFDTGIGFHLNRRHPIIPEGAGKISKSCHSISELKNLNEKSILSYQTLSPIFDSISKSGYLSAFVADELNNIPKDTIALGGVTPDRFRWLQEKGFSGAALLGYVWDRLDLGMPLCLRQ